MERISLFNYEAFYLDFLEGNLSEEDTALFLQFLEQHPELKIDTDLPVLELENRHMDSAKKEALKIVDLDVDPIQLANHETFLIAQLEGLLTPGKNAELEIYINEHNYAEVNRNWLRSTKLIPDPNLKFKNKEGLKIKEFSIVPLIYFAAAIFCIALLVFYAPDNYSVEMNKPYAHTAIPHVEKSKNSHSGSGNTQVSVILGQNKVLTKGLVKSVKVVGAKNDVYTEKEKPVLKLRRAVEVELVKTKQEIVSPNLSQQDVQVAHETTTKSNYPVSLGYQEMNNPIQPITNRLASAIKQDVDFRTAKATHESSGGFYVKLGKLEISHKTFRR